MRGLLAGRPHRLQVRPRCRSPRTSTGRGADRQINPKCGRPRAPPHSPTQPYNGGRHLPHRGALQKGPLAAISGASAASTSASGCRIPRTAAIRTLSRRRRRCASAADPPSRGGSALSGRASVSDTTGKTTSQTSTTTPTPPPSASGRPRVPRRAYRRQYYILPTAPAEQRNAIRFGTTTRDLHLQTARVRDRATSDDDDRSQDDDDPRGTDVCRRTSSAD